MKISLVFVLGVCFVVGGLIIERDDSLEDERIVDETVNEEEANKLPLPPMIKEGAFHGDMLLDDDQWEIVRALENDTSLGKRKAHSDLARRWPNAQIPYYVKLEVEARYGTEITKVVEHYESHTCLDFIKQASLPSSGGYIYVQDGDGCTSKVGYLNQQRDMFLKLGSCKSAIPHEFGHAIGFQHEHVRPDRDSYITVRSENILSGSETFFDINNLISTYGVPYDYKSCMHYESTAFSVNTKTKPTMVTTNPLDMVDMGISDYPNFSDIKLINLMYDCNSGCSAKTCYNEGYQDKSCNCICPDGWEGTDCSTPVTVADDCKNTITGGSGEITSENYPSNYPKNHVCQWYIKGTSPGQTITVNFVDFELEAPNSSGSCLYDDFVAVRKDDLFFGGDIYCGTTSPGSQVVTSTSNPPEMLIYFESDGNSDVKKGFKFTYSIA